MKTNVTVLQECPMILVLTKNGRAVSYRVAEKFMAANHPGKGYTILTKDHSTRVVFDNEPVMNQAPAQIKENTDGLE